MLAVPCVFADFRVINGLLTALLLVLVRCGAAEGAEYPVHYTIQLQPEKHSALVTVAIDDARLLRELDFNIDPELHDEIKANGQLAVEGGRALWIPPDKNARLTLRARINHERSPGEYDAFITEDWAIFRGDDLVPPAAVRTVAGARSRATLEFKLPETWPSVNTGWKRMEGKTFRVENPHRRFDRPTGWMIAGKLGTRRTQLNGTHIAVSAPRGSTLHRMDVLTFLTFVWPELFQAFRQTPSKLLIVGAGTPMWRGGLSASNSFFLHADRPLVSENGTSPLMHELVHRVTGIRGTEGNDWIAEGIAEFYSVELLYRAGGMTRARRDKIFAQLADWGNTVDTLSQQQSTGATTARAAVLFEQLDREIRERTGGSGSLDDIVRELMDRKVSLDSLAREVSDLVGGKAVTLAQFHLEQG
jgi:hypothetical protein